MRIAINARLLIPGKLEGMGLFTRGVIKKMIEFYPENDYIMFFDRKPADEFLIPGVEYRVLQPPARHPLFYRLWFDVLVPWHVRNWDAEIFLSFDGFTSLHLHIPRITVIHDLAYTHFPEYMKSSDLHYYQKFQPKFARVSDQLLTVSNFSAHDISVRYGIDEKRIRVVYNGSRFEENSPPVDNNLPVTFGLESGKYFIYTGSIHPRKNIGKLIIAFGQSEAAARHGVKLVLAGRMAWKTGEIENLLRESPLKTQIVQTGYISDSTLWSLLNNALAMCYVSIFEGFGVPILDAFHAGVPVICSAITSMPEVAGDAALLVDPEDASAIAGAMDAIFLDDDQRKELIRKGDDRKYRFSWKLTTRKIFGAVEDAYRNGA